jgi:hypothetical protein
MLKKITLILLFFYSNHVLARSATSTAQSLQTVLACLTVHKESDLNFGEAPQADPAKTVPPGRAENSENASFEVNGEPGTAFSIVLPTNNAVKMTVSGGGANQEIAVSSFTSYPATQGVVAANGESIIYVGATRAKLASNQKPGKYSGTFSVSIVY